MRQSSEGFSDCVLRFKRLNELLKTDLPKTLIELENGRNSVLSYITKVEIENTELKKQVGERQEAYLHQKKENAKFKRIINILEKRLAINKKFMDEHHEEFN